MLELFFEISAFIYTLFIGQLIYGFNKLERFTKKEIPAKTTRHTRSLHQKKRKKQHFKSAS